MEYDDDDDDTHTHTHTFSLALRRRCFVSKLAAVNFNYSYLCHIVFKLSVVFCSVKFISRCVCFILKRLKQPSTDSAVPF